ncbi:DUF4438 domain-containing protein [bacterium (Candidatus Blackallbacteria) CG17_big_fil_post_rev_8_21_14_2_50_48_46]|uniref:DUF4438 domain-containing protein n=1 Tax=bacterium (Candidatus Blackallbacteria) CG17_big_fil_post_rev_8_21_14_2_50_48_46 TaxID=2014261 RepID=A0A2M7GB02_9BACT|nr:MAG: DUF4438 domain-containing protein [bacterium (Candidatus Blackallbacteria) CG18_big_fil_WC_8_21_14_2_50_49_26]PIW19348.1 MAG: DUF4438 domain-containing protein [bacterium (Candidatus Blackallbacteria) CG17_big_fil_post_rev_8_21_14_2_50_48_46]PIW49048.1 MAG: DUF4438 domain-containing protein [bacterium (Candidatus Blackallbacteria) CG13_big_fil_rev_8_21_14_2_50_49_14]
MLKTNESSLIMNAVQGSPIYPGASGWRVSHDGKGLMLPGVGGINYNLKVGDSAFGWVADHAEPAVSSTASLEKREQGVNLSYNYFACIGNEARIISGEAKGAKGIVTGTHGGCEHVMIDFSEEVLDLLSYEDRIQIRAFGQGLALSDYPEVLIWSLAPSLLHKMGIEEDPGEKLLRVPVVATVPAELLGSGLGRTDGYKADIDIQTSDQAYIRQLGLDKLKLGDFVALMDYKSYYGWSFQKGAVTIGIVCHTDSYTAGHGPGVTTLLTSTQGEIQPLIYPNANIGQYLKIGRYRVE